MPRFDGTGPLGKGPMTGQGEGFCVLRKSGQDSHTPEGFAGLRGKPIGKLGQVLERIEKEVDTPLSGGTTRIEVGPATGNAPDLRSPPEVPRYTYDAALGRDRYGSAVAAFLPYAIASRGHGVLYSVPYGRWVHPWLRRGFGLHLGGGFGRGRRRGGGKLGY